MREMLSRGKRIDSNEWVYWNRYGRLTDINGEPTKIEINTSILRPYAFYINELPVIKAHTVGDYTGLTDKNGKKIFEGDIVKYTRLYDIGCYPHSETEKTVVKYNFHTGFYPVCVWGTGNYEVIGNIHDNPELLQEDIK